MATEGGSRTELSLDTFDALNFLGLDSQCDDFWLSFPCVDSWVFLILTAAREKDVLVLLFFVNFSLLLLLLFFFNFS